jgi:hypothetical protein
MLPARWQREASTMVDKPTAPLDLETLAAQLAALRARLDAQPLPQEQDAYKVAEFCRRHRISVSTFHKLRKEGRGPRVMQPGAQARISKEAAAAWRKKMAAEANSEAEKLAHARRIKAAKIGAAASKESPNHVSQKPKKRP